MKYVIDSHAWIDYFDANEAGQKIKEYIENDKNEIITNVLNLAEVSSFFKRKNISIDRINESFKIIFSLSKIHNLDSDFSQKAGFLHAEMRKKIKDFGLIDAFVLLTAKVLTAKVITGDPHFNDLKEAILI